MAKVSDRNTKAEILAAYQELQNEKASLESQFQQSSNGKSNGNNNGNVTVVAEPIKPLISSPSNKPKMQQVLESLTLLQSGFGGAVSELSEQLTREATQLQELKKNVELELEELKTLHSLEDVNDDTLDVLVQRYEENAKTFTEELTQQQETLEQQFQEQQKAWQKEQLDYQKATQERNENYKTSQTRDQESYQYDLQLKRDLDHEEYEQNQQTLYKQLEELQQQQEKQWEEREKALTEKEKEYADVKAKVEEFAQKLEDNIKRGKEIGRNIGNYQAKIKADLFAKEVEGQKQFFELRIKSLSETIKNQENRIQNLSKQLDSALKQVQDLAVKAIEGSSNASSFQAMKEIAIEQAKNQQKGK
ncbi:MAG: hypothetical protein ACOVQ7_17760 [Limnoraphis robusta]